MPPWWHLPAAYLLDLALGDPRWLPHPVVLIGRVADALERAARSVCRSPLAQRVAGVALTGGVVLGTGGVAWAAVALAGRLHPAAGSAMEVALLWTALAARSLADHVGAVWRPLAAGDLEGARRAVALVVGRDTERLDEAGVARAAVETAAESASDGFVAPLFWGLLGGAPLALAYKAVNTLDSMWGHKDERYLHFGWAAARLDDAANWLPARLTGLLLALAAGLIGGRPGGGPAARNAWRVLRRDARKHPSPNSGYPEAAMAGALDLQLGGFNSYGGEASFRPYLGEGGRSPQAGDILRALRLVQLAALLAVVMATAMATAAAALAAPAAVQ